MARIVHGASNIAGLPVQMARAQRALGHRATAILYPTARGPAAGAVDLQRLVAGNRVSRQWRRARLLSWLIQEYDVFHFHFHTTYLPGHRDLALLRAARKRIVFHLHGCDIRDPRRVRVEHAISACAECPVQCLVHVKRALPEALTRYADTVIVSTPDLLEFVPDAVYLPNPVDITHWEDRTGAMGEGTDGRLIVAHAPTDRAIKGTRYVEEAIALLRREGLPVELHLLEGLTPEQLRAACMRADVIVDQVLIGWYGLFAAETMALGKPVVAYIRPDLEPYALDLPIASAGPDTLADTLRRLLRSPEERRALSVRGPAYVRAHHDPREITAQVLDLYQHERHVGRQA